MMTVELLYPEIANLYGELGNIEYLQRSVPACDVRRTGLEDRPAFLDGGVDLVYMGSMTERAQSVAAARLAPFREEIRRAVEEGQAFLITGNAMELFGTGIDDTDGTHVDGLGLFPFHTTRDMLGRYKTPCTWASTAIRTSWATKASLPSPSRTARSRRCLRRSGAPA